MSVATDSQNVTGLRQEPNVASFVRLLTEPPMFSRRFSTDIALLAEQKKPSPFADIVLVI